jgi:hypothetical protein
VTEHPPHSVEAPPAGEELHLPGSSIIPLLNASGLAVALVGLATTLLFTIAGLLLFLVTLVVWIRDVRRDVDDLPLDHTQH